MIERFPKCDTGCALLERDKCVHLCFDFFNRQFQALEIAEQGGCRRKRVCTRGGRFGYFGHVIQLAAGLDNDQKLRSSDMVRDSTFCREASQRCWPAVRAASRAGRDVCGLSVYTSATDAEALEAFQLLCRTEGIIPALEPSHAIAAVARIAPTMPKDSIIIVNMCGRGDKDIFSVAEHLGVELLSATKGRGTGRVIEDTGAADFGSMRDG